MSRVLDACWLGRVPYEPAWRLQRALAAARAAGEAPDLLLLLEHPPVFTLGRAARVEHLRWSLEECTRRGVEVHAVDRGGDITYHGPGQLVAYPILDLHGLGLGVRAYVRALEQAMLDMLAAHGVEGVREPGLPGVWVAGAKVGAIGVRCSRGVTTHGFAFNVDPDLTHFTGIVPCGLPDRPVTSLARLAGRSLAVDELVLLAGRCVARALGFDEVRWRQPAEVQALATAGAQGASGS